MNMKKTSLSFRWFNYVNLTLKVKSNTKIQHKQFTNKNNQAIKKRGKYIVK